MWKVEYELIEKKRDRVRLKFNSGLEKMMQMILCISVWRAH
jgi:hypothetical protein